MVLVDVEGVQFRHGEGRSQIKEAVVAEIVMWLKW